MPKLEDLRARLAAWDGGLDDEALQSMVFAVGKDHGFEPLRDWFKALYEVLLGASVGPRFGGFIALYGVEETIALIDEAKQSFVDGGSPFVGPVTNQDGDIVVEEGEQPTYAEIETMDYFVEGVVGQIG